MTATSDDKRNKFLEIDYRLENYWKPNNPQRPKIKTIVCKCPRIKCHGFILQGTNQCGSCNTLVCLDCRHEVNPSHVCDPQTIETIKLIESESKPCPGCGISIHKIEGCYQMWCTQCHTTFHYRTGEILKEAIHNPHYVEWLKSVKPTSIETTCNDDVISLEHLDLNLKQCGACSQQYNLVTSMRQTCDHLLGIKQETEYKVDKLADEFRAHNTRMEYILNNITMIEFKKTLYRKFKQVCKYRDDVALVDTIVVYIHSLLYHYIFKTMDWMDIKIHLDDFVDNVNHESNRLVKLYNGLVPTIKFRGYKLYANVNNGRESLYVNKVEKNKGDCNVCCEMKQIFKCDECEYMSCKDCFERVVFNSINEASCINCKVHFDKGVLVSKLGRNWYEKKYKLHLYDLLFEREELQFEKSCEFYRLQQERDTLYKEWKFLMYKEYKERFSNY